MKHEKTALFVVLTTLLCVFLAGCAPSLQARKVDEDVLHRSVLFNPDILVKGGEGQALYRYQRPNVDWKKYTKLIVDPVIVYEAAELNADTRDNYQKLANNAYAYFTKDLEQEFTLVTVPGPDTLRIQFAIVSAAKSSTVYNLLTTIVPVGMAVSAVQYGVTGKPAGVGEVTGEMRLTDSQTGEMLGAAIDKRVGGKQLRGVFDSWQDADSALQFWAKLTRWRLCEVRNPGTCAKWKP